MAEPAPLVEKDGHIATVTMNRPEVRNALNPEMLCRMADAWDEIDGDWWTIPAEKSKNGLAHRVPISDLAKTILAGVNGDERRVWVFPSPTLPRSHVANQHGAVVAIRKATGLDFQPHDLRRTAASLMAGLGIQRLTIGKVLNHAEPGITSVYDRYGYDREKQGALKAWSKELERIVSGEKVVTSNVVELSNV